MGKSSCHAPLLVLILTFIIVSCTALHLFVSSCSASSCGVGVQPRRCDVQCGGSVVLSTRVRRASCRGLGVRADKARGRSERDKGKRGPSTRLPWALLVERGRSAAMCIGPRQPIGLGPIQRKCCWSMKN